MNVSVVFSAVATVAMMFSVATDCQAQRINIGNPVIVKAPQGQGGLHINSPFPQGQPRNGIVPQVPRGPLVYPTQPQWQPQPQNQPQWQPLPQNQPRWQPHNQPQWQPQNQPLTQPQNQPRWQPQPQTQPQQVWFDQWGNPVTQPTNPVIHKQQTVKYKYDQFGNLVVDNTVEQTKQSALDPNRAVIDPGSMTKSSSVRFENGFQVTTTTYRWTSYGKPHHRTEVNRRAIGQQGGGDTLIDRGGITKPGTEGK